MYTHAFFTWLTANLLHPVMFCIFRNEPGSAWLMIVEGLPYSCLYSLPSLFMCLVVIYILAKIPGDAGSRFVIWFLSTAAMPTINLFMFLMVFTRYELQSEDLKLIVPATLAVIITVLIRIVHFFRVFSQLDREKESKSIA